MLPDDALDSLMGVKGGGQNEGERTRTAENRNIHPPMEHFPKSQYVPVTVAGARI